jgi:hypothetical protein
MFLVSFSHSGVAYNYGQDACTGGVYGVASSFEQKRKEEGTSRTNDSYDHDEGGGGSGKGGNDTSNIKEGR